MKKLVKVIGAIVENENNEILCALRSPRMSLPNMWEFPGGKIEKDETFKQAIEREISEELSCRVEFIDVFN
ncbi:mutator mutT protein, partial [Clostridium botulinum CFSAN001627]